MVWKEGRRQSGVGMCPCHGFHHVLVSRTGACGRLLTGERLECRKGGREMLMDEKLKYCLKL